MSLVDHNVAAQSAEQRATSCRERLELLQGGAPLTVADVARAQQALQSARLRALAASVRVATRRNMLTTLAGARRDFVHVDDAAEPLTALLAAGEVSMSDLTVAYLGLGGSCSILEIDGYVNGALRLPRTEAALLSEAFSELD